jgi:glucose-1-phosphate thymidylyltransferase
VRHPERYGVVEFDQQDHPAALVEKPVQPNSNWAVTGLYFYDNRVLDMVTSLRPSARGELEITDVNRMYLERGALHIEKLGRGFAWLDTGTPESLVQAAQFIETVEQRQGLKIACLEEIALRLGYITLADFERRMQRLANSAYGEYLARIAQEFSRDTRHAR